MLSKYHAIHCIHALDATTAFLGGFKNLDVTYLAMEPDEESIEACIAHLKNIVSGSLIVFLGHGSSTGLYSPSTDFFPRRTIINDTVANKFFKGNDILLLSCKSAEFSKQLHTYNQVIGFGNILSSYHEVVGEAEHSGRFRDVDDTDIEYFNHCYATAIIHSLQLTISGRKKFEDLPRLIAYFVNKEINSVLRQKEKRNRIEVARLLFEFRNEMVYKRN